MLTLRRILVPTDFSEGAEVARFQAERLAVQHRAEVHVLHVTGATCSDTTLSKDEAHGMSKAQEAKADPGTELDRSGVSGRRAASQAAPIVQRADSVVEAILAYADAHDIDVIVMGTHGRRGIRDALLGTTLERVLRLARVPVLTVRAGCAVTQPETAKRVLVGVDFAEASRSLIAHARHLAAAWQASVDLVYVVEDPRFPAFFRLDAFHAALPDLAHRARKMLQALAEATDGPVAEMRYHALTGDPTSTLVGFAEAQKSDIILLATHGWTGLKWFTLGSVAEAVVRTAPCPVLTIKSYGKSLVAKTAEGSSAAQPSATPRSRSGHRAAPRAPAKGLLCKASMLEPPLDPASTVDRGW